MELLNLKYNCRICLKPRKGFEDVYRYVVEGFKDPLVQLVFSLFEIQLQTHQAYPQFMCKRCLNKLTHILLFKQEMIRNQEILFDLFKASHSNYVEKKIEFRESIPSKYSSAVSNWTNMDDFELKLDGLVDDCITIKSEPLTSAKLRSSVQSQETSRYLNSFQSHLTVKRHSPIDYQSTQIMKESFPTRTTRSTRDLESQLQQSSKIKCRENIHKIFADFSQANNCDKIYVKKETDFDDSSRNNVVLQASFLQNLNLITLQHAQMLKTLQEQSIKTRQRGALLKGSRHKIANISMKTSKSKYRVQKSRIKLPPKQIKAHTNSTGLGINISDKFLPKTRHKKLNTVGVKPEKRFCQSNVVSKVEDKDKGILKTFDSLVPLVHSTVKKTDAISKQIGCETDYEVKRLSAITPKQNLISTFRLNHKRDKCNINDNNSHNKVIEKVEIVTERKRKANRLRSTKRVQSHFVRTDLSNLNSKLLTDCIHYNVPPDIIVKPNTEDVMSSHIQGKSVEKNSVLRKLRSSESTEEISQKYEPGQNTFDRNLRNTYKTKRKFSTSLSLSSSRSFHVSPVSYNNNLERKADMMLINGRHKRLYCKTRKVNVVNSCIKLGNKDSTILRKSDSAMLEDSKLDRSRTHSVALQKRNILISELQSPKRRVRKSSISSSIDLINNNSKVHNAICTDLDQPGRGKFYCKQSVTAPRKVAVGKRKWPTCIINGATNIKDEYTSCNSSLKNLSGHMKCQISSNSIDVESCAVDVKQFERKLRRSNLSQNVCGYKFEIKSNKSGHSNKIESHSVSESDNSKRSNQVRHYPLHCKTRIVNIDDNHELQLSVISGDSPISDPNRGSSQTLACLDTKTHLKAENCYFAFDSKYCVVKLEPEANIRLKRKRHPPVIYSPSTSPHKDVAKRKVCKDYFMKIGPVSKQQMS